MSEFWAEESEKGEGRREKQNIRQSTKQPTKNNNKSLKPVPQGRNQVMFMMYKCTNGTENVRIGNSVV